MRDLKISNHACPSCGSRRFSAYWYNNHSGLKPIPSRPKKLVGFVLPYFNFMMPKFVGKFKRISSKPFRGKVLVCSNCGHGKLAKSPSEDQLLSYYRDKYWDKRDVTFRGTRTNDFDYARANCQVQFVKHHLSKNPPRRVLEVGAGRAYPLELLREEFPGCKLFACEPDNRWQGSYAERGITQVARLFPFTSKFKFDYIHMSHCLEHIAKLNETMESLRDLVTQDGFAFVEVPNTGHEYWDLPVSNSPHIHFFTGPSLRNMFEKFGFRCLEIGEFGITFKEAVEGTSVKPGDYCRQKRKGFWIRAVFQKVDNKSVFEGPVNSVKTMN